MLKRALKHDSGGPPGPRRVTNRLEAANAQTGIETLYSREPIAGGLCELEAANAQTGIETVFVAWWVDAYCSKVRSRECSNGH